jgi:hypothetical protein
MSNRARNSIRGRKAQLVGDAFEVWCDQQHEVALQLGILAHVVHNQPTAKFVGGKLIYVSAGVADYTGMMERCIMYNGTFAAEAKSVDPDKKRLYRSRIEDKQAEHLDCVAKAGGLALLLVEFRAEDGLHARYAIPWLDVPWTKARTADSLDENQILYYRVVECYLRRWHPGGPRTSNFSLVKKRNFARE